MNTYVFSSSRSFRIFLAIAAMSSLLTGCSITRITFADPQVEPFLKSLSQRTTQPLAQTLTWKYHYTVGTGKSMQTWLIADGKLMRSAKELSSVEWYASRPISSDVSMIDVYTERAREATRRGDHRSAQIYHGASEVSLQTQIASERVATGMALGSAIQGLGGALLDATITSHGLGVAEYVRAPERGVIGAAAPEGSVLELLFRGTRLDGKAATPGGGTNMRWETVATLKDAEGKIWRSASSFVIYHVYADDPDAPIPTELDNDAYVRLVPGSLIPVNNRDFVPEENEMKKVWAKGGAAEFAVTAMQAINDVYAQIEIAKAGAR